MQPLPKQQKTQISVTRTIINSFYCPEILKSSFLERESKGITTYGSTLQPFNNRDAMLDCFEELLDATQYAKQRTLENNKDMIAYITFLLCLFVAYYIKVCYFNKNVLHNKRQK
jgi:hypothetical protein